eukprot:TRINITY_DN31608_c0_g1_i1.p1 TRINITY_DN31608_c0_g1~~TRINITY_DN31608_c0_g1_i1.p1  ORF type:complete len:259 (-),score=85.09 TRINITY_DN31608_c0_g1_i1:42-818(-)
MASDGFQALQAAVAKAQEKQLLLEALQQSLAVSLQEQQTAAPDGVEVQEAPATSVSPPWRRTVPVEIALKRPVTPPRRKKQAQTADDPREAHEEQPMPPLLAAPAEEDSGHDDVEDAAPSTPPLLKRQRMQPVSKVVPKPTKAASKLLPKPKPRPAIVKPAPSRIRSADQDAGLQSAGADEQLADAGEQVADDAEEEMAYYRRHSEAKAAPREKKRRGGLSNPVVKWHCERAAAIAKGSAFFEAWRKDPANAHPTNPR